MNSLTGTREELGGYLEAIAPTFAYLPERINPPVILIGPGAAMLEPNTYCDYTYNLELTLVAGKGTNVEMATALDQLVVDTFLALPNSWGYGNVSKPFQLEANNTSYYAVTLAVSKNINLE